MAKFFDKVKKSAGKSFDASFFNNFANLILIVVALLLVIQIFISPTFLVAIALLGLFLWALLYC